MLQQYFGYLYRDTVKQFEKYFYSAFEYNPSATLLDCGCLDGEGTLSFGKKIGTKKLYGIDIDNKNLKLARGKNIITRLGDLNEKFPYPDKKFDVVVANHVIEHLINVHGFVSEIYRVLKNGGYAVIGTPNLASWHNIFALLIGIQPFSGPTIHPNFKSDINIVKNLNKNRFREVFSDYFIPAFEHNKVMTTRELIKLFKNRRFKIESVSGHGYYPLIPILSKPFSALDPYHSHYVVLKARK